MDTNVDQCSAVECTAAQHRLNKSPKVEDKSLYVFFSLYVLLLALVERFRVSRLRDFYLLVSLFLLFHGKYQELNVYKYPVVAC